MSNIAKIELPVVQGSETTDYDFVPRGFPAQDVSEYFELESTTVPVGQPRIQIRIRRGTANQDPVVAFQIDVPTLAETSPSTSTGVKPAAVRSYNHIAKGEFRLPRSGEMSERDVLLQLFQGLAASSVIADAVKGLDFPY